MQAVCCFSFLSLKFLINVFWRFHFISHASYLIVLFVPGLWCHKSWVCWWSSSKMSFPKLVSAKYSWAFSLEKTVWKLYTFAKMVFIIFHSIGRPKHVRVMAGALEGDIFIGKKAEVCKIIIQFNSSYSLLHHKVIFTY